MSGYDETTAEQLAAARKVMARYDVAMSVLAKGDASPHMTEEFKEKLNEAANRLERYKTVNR